jgi:hypothetical protein
MTARRRPRPKRTRPGCVPAENVRDGDALEWALFCSYPTSRGRRKR